MPSSRELVSPMEDMMLNGAHSKQTIEPEHTTVRALQLTAADELNPAGLALATVLSLGLWMMLRQLVELGAQLVLR
jgi:hypothetical protein